MNLLYSSPPVVGQPFQVEIVGFAPPAIIRIYIGERLFRESDCPDEPCHEMAIIPEGTAGATLRVIAVDSSGTKEELEFTIKGAAGSYAVARAE